MRSGRDFDKDVALCAEDQVSRLIEEATSIENLSALFIGCVADEVSTFGSADMDQILCILVVGECSCNNCIVSGQIAGSLSLIHI